MGINHTDNVKCGVVIIMCNKGMMVWGHILDHDLRNMQVVRKKVVGTVLLFSLGSQAPSL